MKLLSASQEFSQEKILSTLINELSQTTLTHFLILDDYHVITETSIHHLLEYLLKYLPPCLHIILLTRTDPPWSLSLLRARRQILEVQLDQLRCTDEETTLFLEMSGKIKLSSEMLREIINKTEGWFVGLQLFNHSLQGQTDPSDILDQLHGSQRHILEFVSRLS